MPVHHTVLEAATRTICQYMSVRIYKHLAVFIVPDFFIRVNLKRIGVGSNFVKPRPTNNSSSSSQFSKAVMDSDCDMFPSVCSCHAYVYACVLATGTIRPLDTLLNRFKHVPGCPLAPKV